MIKRNVVRAFKDTKRKIRHDLKKMQVRKTVRAFRRETLPQIERGIDSRFSRVPRALRNIQKANTSNQSERVKVYQAMLRQQAQQEALRRRAAIVEEMKEKMLYDFCFVQPDKTAFVVENEVRNASGRGHDRAGDLMASQINTEVAAFGTLQHSAPSSNVHREVFAHSHGVDLAPAKMIDAECFAIGNLVRVNPSRPVRRRRK